MSKKDDRNLRSMIAQLLTVAVIFLFIAVALLVYIATRPTHYEPVRQSQSQSVRVQVTCPGNVGGVPIVNGKG
jgi:hypothetical protein